MYRVYPGTYTDKVSKGIFQFELELKDGTLSPPTMSGETSSLSFVAFHPNRNNGHSIHVDKAIRFVL